MRTRRTLFAAALVLAVPAALLADFSYQQESKMTGGSLMAAMKIAGAMSHNARAAMDTTSHIYVKGNKMATVSDRSMSIIDADAETITTVDLEKQTYSVITFAQMKAAMEEMARRMQGKNAEGTSMQFDVKVDVTGRSGTFAGLETQQKVMRLKTIMNDQKSGQSGGMDMVSDMWLASGVKGYEEIARVGAVMAQKLGYDPRQGMNAMMMRQPGASQGMAKMSEEMSKLQGVPVLQIVTMTSSGAPVTISEKPEVPQPSEQAASSPSAGDMVKKSIFGGLGGFGRKKKDEQEAPPAQAPQSGQPDTALMQMAIVSSNFSSAPVDDAKFQVPAGFKQVESPMAKMAKEN